MTKRKAQTQPKHPEAATSSVKLSTQPTGLVKKARHQKRLEVVQQTDTSAAEKLLDIDDIFKTARKAIKNATPAAEVIALDDPRMPVGICAAIKAQWPFRLLRQVPPKSAKRVKGSKDDIFGLGQPAGRR